MIDTHAHLHLIDRPTSDVLNAAQGAFAGDKHIVPVPLILTAFIKT